MLVAVAAVVAGVGVLAATAPAPATAPPAAPAIAPVDAQSSSWYCVGGPAGSLGHFGILLANTGSRPVAGTVTVVGNRGRSAAVAVTVPARREVRLSPAPPAAASWAAARVDLAGGGVVAYADVAGPTGWSQAPCTTTAAATWSFAGGSAAGGATLTTLLFNPTATPAVADVTLVTPGGVTQPPPDQGVVVAPGQLVALDPGRFLEGQPEVATLVTTRSGRLVAAQVERRRPASSLSLTAGVTAPAPGWALPATTNVPQGSTSLEVLNPTARPERVTVRVHLPTGPTAPFVATVAPTSLWTLPLGSETRIPASVPYLVAVRASGAGVVVGRTVEAPAGTVAPRSGLTVGLATGSAARRWFVPGPGTQRSPIVARARIGDLSIIGAGPGTATVTVRAGGPTGPPLPDDAHLAVGPSGLLVAAVPARRTTSLWVEASAPVLVAADLQPAGAAGVVSVRGLPVEP